MQIKKIKDKIMESIESSLNHRLYCEQEDTLWYDDYEKEMYRNKINEIRQEYKDDFRFVKNSDVIELKDDELKIQVFENMKDGKVLQYACKCLNNACKCLDVEKIKLYTLVHNGVLEMSGDRRVTHVFCGECEKFVERIYYNYSNVD